MVKKDPAPLITKLDFPWLPLLVLATAFVLLLLTLSRYYQPAPTSTVTPTLPAKATATAGPVWQIHKDPIFNYQINYPLDWTTVKDQSGFFEIRKGNEAKIIIDTTSFSKITETVDKWVRKTYSSSKILPQDYKFSSISTNPIVVDNGLQSQIGRRYYLNHNDKIWEITWEQYLGRDTNSDAIREMADEISQVLSTFKFLPQTASTSPWHTYISSKFGFSFEYPASSVVENTSDMPYMLAVSSPNKLLFTIYVVDAGEPFPSTKECDSLILGSKKIKHCTGRGESGEENAYLDEDNSIVYSRYGPISDLEFNHVLSTFKTKTN